MSDRFSQELIDKVNTIFTDQNVYQIMLTMTKQQIISREYRKVMIFSLSTAYCEKYNIDFQSEECSNVLSYLYINLMNSMHILFAEPIIRVLHGDIPATDQGKELSQQLYEAGLETTDKFEGHNVYNLDAFRAKKGTN